MKLFKIFLPIFIILVSNIANSYQRLYVQDPQNPWRGGYGTIEEAAIEVNPCGIYMEYTLSLTFSAKNLYFYHYDTLEVQLDFDLPENSIVHDSWLLIGDKWVRALMLDRWTASNFYEETVNRRRDPSILYKNQNGDYQLRVYPMAGDGIRKVKISYLVPADWNSTTVTAPLPSSLIGLSYNTPSAIKLIVRPNEKFGNPGIAELPDTHFASKTDSMSVPYLEADLPGSSVTGTLNITFDTPLKNGIFVSRYSTAEDGYYQMAFLPSEALDIKASKKVAVLIDYDASRSSYSKNDLLSSLKSALISGLNKDDSINLIFSNLNITRISGNWLPADSGTIENIFNNLDSDLPSDYSNMPPLIADGIDFIRNHGNDGSILLISNSDQVGDYKSANRLINDLLALMEPKLPINVVNYQNKNISYNVFGGRTYLGNEYFYLNITRLTSANYFTINTQGASLEGIISSAVESLNGFIKSFDLHTKLANGFCYARYNLSDNFSSVYLNQPILQVGKYQGEFPFIIEASGVYQSSAFSKTFSLDDSTFILTDSLNRNTWAGNYINYLEEQYPNNDIINEILARSIEERILTVYTAFLCPEPGQEVEICYDCLYNNDQGGPVTGVKKDSVQKNDSLSLAAYPNPFNNSTKIIVSLPDKLSGKNITTKIYNILGQEIRSFDASQFGNGGRISLFWDGKNNYGSSVSSGTYLFVLNTGNKVYSTKLLLLK